MVHVWLCLGLIRLCQDLFVFISIPGSLGLEIRIKIKEHTHAHTYTHLQCESHNFFCGNLRKQLRYDIGSWLEIAQIETLFLHTNDHIFFLIIGISNVQKVYDILQYFPYGFDTNCLNGKVWLKNNLEIVRKKNILFMKFLPI